MFERFTTDARLIVVNSQAHARRLGHNHIGCEHLLLSLASLDDTIGQTIRDAGATPSAVEATIQRLVGGGRLFEGIDRAALAAIGIDLDLVRQQVEAQFGLTQAPARPRRRRWRRRRTCGHEPGRIALTPRAKKLLEISLREALAQRSKHIGTEHVALAMIRMNDSLAGEILSVLGVSPAALRTNILGRHRQAG